MKLNIIFVLVLVTAVAQQGDSSTLKSSIRNEIVQILNDTNNIVGQVSNVANDYFLQKLTNETEIKEWSVNIQIKVNTGITKFAFEVFNAYKDYVIAKYGSDIEKKVLTCISNEESGLLAAVSNGTNQFGWCNNRLAANLTRAFQDTTQNLVELSDALGKDIDALSSCLLGDDLCLSAFLVKVVALAQTAFTPSGDDLLTALEDVVRVYTIMFGQDVPTCATEYLLPIVLEGIETALTNIASCINS